MAWSFSIASMPKTRLCIQQVLKHGISSGHSLSRIGESALCKALAFPQASKWPFFFALWGILREVPFPHFLHLEQHLLTLCRL